MDSPSDAAALMSDSWYKTRGLRHIVVPLAREPFAELKAQAQARGLSMRAHFSEIVAAYLARAPSSTGSVRPAYKAADAVRARFHLPQTVHAKLNRRALVIGCEMTAIAFTALMEQVDGGEPKKTSPPGRHKG